MEVTLMKNMKKLYIFLLVILSIMSIDTVYSMRKPGAAAKPAGAAAPDDDDDALLGMHAVQFEEKEWLCTSCTTDESISMDRSEMIGHILMEHANGDDDDHVAQQPESKPSAAAQPAPKKSVYTCKHPGCGLILTTYARFKKHIVNHNNPALIQCLQCKYYFGTAKKMTRHKRECKGMRPKNGTNPQRLEALKYIRSKNGIHSCTLCKNSSNPKKSNVVAHVIRMHPEKLHIDETPKTSDKSRKRKNASLGRPDIAAAAAPASSAPAGDSKQAAQVPENNLVLDNLVEHAPKRSRTDVGQNNGDDGDDREAKRAHEAAKLLASFAGAHVAQVTHDDDTGTKTTPGEYACPEPDCNLRFETEYALRLHKQAHDRLRNRLKI